MKNKKVTTYAEATYVTPEYVELVTGEVLRIRPGSTLPNYRNGGRCNVKYVGDLDHSTECEVVGC